MRIGIDIDGVITNDDEYIIDCTSKYCYENNLKCFTFPYEYEYKKLKWNNKIIENYRKKYFDDYIDNVTPRKFVSEVIKKLKLDGHKIFIITARYKTFKNTKKEKDLRIRTKKWLEKNDIIYDELIFAKLPKKEEIIKYKINIMIEDYPETILEIKKIIPVLCYDARYNKNLKCNNVIRVFSWYDIYMKINNML